MIAELYALMQQELRFYAQGRTGDAALAEDVLQDVFVSALTHEATLRRLTPGQRRAWMYTAVRRRIVDAKRAARRLTALEETYDAPVHSDFSAPIVLEALAALTPEQRRVVELRHFAGLDSRQIAALLGIPDATVRTRLRAARKRLQNDRDEGKG